MFASGGSTSRMNVQPIDAGATAHPTFVRDRFTWTIYLLLGYFAFLQSLLGPLMPFLRAELNMGYVAGSLHLSTFAAGMVLIGLVGDRVIRRLGFRIALWGGALGMAVGALGLAVGTHVGMTIAATACMGVVGTVLLVTQQASLAHHHGETRTIAFTEANIVASLCSMLAPLAIGAAVGAGLNWRVALFIPIPMLLLLLAREGRRAVPEPAAEQVEQARQQRLPAVFWGYWAVGCLSVAVEWSIAFWGTDYLNSVVGMPLERAVTTMGIFFLCMLLGRMAGSRLARRVPPGQLLTSMLTLGLVGVLILWLAPLGTVTLVGLAIAGLGVGNLFPFSLAVAAGIAPRQVAAVSARMTLAGGSAILIAPLVLGGFAAQIGLRSAFGIVPALLAVALMMALAAQRASRVQLPAS
jgi:fucose permease